MVLDVIGRHLSGRLLRFCVVGASGVGVNLAVLALLVELARIPAVAAAAVAIEASILSNFALNDRWTFGDRRTGGVVSRLARFQLVSVFGAVAQWSVFLTLHALWQRPYAAQLVGIAVAVGWNFAMNLHWTWRAEAQPAEAK